MRWRILEKSRKIFRELGKHNKESKKYKVKQNKEEKCGQRVRKITGENVEGKKEREIKNISKEKNRKEILKNQEKNFQAPIN